MKFLVCSCLALNDLLRGRPLDDIIDKLPEIWEILFRVQDDIKVKERIIEQESSTESTVIKLWDVWRKILWEVKMKPMGVLGIKQMRNSGPLQLKFPCHLGNSLCMFLMFLNVGFHSCCAYSWWFSIFPGYKRIPKYLLNSGV